MADRTGERIQDVMTASPQVLPERTVVREAVEAMRVTPARHWPTSRPPHPMSSRRGQGR